MLIPFKYELSSLHHVTGSEEVYVTVTEETSVLLIHVSNIVDDELGPEMNVTQHSVHRLLSSVNTK